MQSIHWSDPFRRNNNSSSNNDLIVMGKKKSNRGADTRGYSTTTASLTKTIASASSGSSTTNKKQSSTTTVVKNGSGSTTTTSTDVAISITASFHQNLEELLTLLRDLKHDDDSNDKSNNQKDSDVVTGTPPIIHDQRFMRRCGILINKLQLEYNFTIDQMKQYFTSLSSCTDVNEVNALDWLCLHLPTTELPSLFTEGNVREYDGALLSNVDGQSSRQDNLEVIVPLLSSNESSTTTRLDAYGTSTNEIQQNLLQSPASIALTKLDAPATTIEEDSAVSASTDSKISAVKTQVEEKIDAQQKLWLLSQYQYDESNDSNDDDYGDTNDASRNQVEEGRGWKTTPTGQSSDTARTPASLLQQQTSNAKNADDEKTVELMKSLRSQLKELEDDIGNDANNYMRNKYEMKEMRKNIHELRQKIQGMERKITKKTTTTTNTANDSRNNTADDQQQRQEHQHSASTDLSTKITHDEDDYDYCDADDAGDRDDEDGDDDNVGMSSLFDENAAASQPKAVVTKNDNPEDDDTDDYVHIDDDAIPKSWTGKTPKIILEEFLRKKDKKKYIKPTFQKLSTDGCKLAIQLNGGSGNKKDDTIEVVVKARCSMYEYLQEYAATIALYQFNPNVPLYRLFPPFFRNLWLSWIERAKNDVLEVDAKLSKERLAVIHEIIACIPRRAVGKYAGDQALQQSTLRAGGMGQGDLITTNDDFTQISRPGEDIDDWDTQDKVENKSSRIKGYGKKDIIEYRNRCQSSLKYLNMFEVRKSLPTYLYREKILETIQKHQVTIISAETGSGKTTQCASYILEHSILQDGVDPVSILCTQPRRVAAMSVAERVAEELGEEFVGNLIGYQVRLEAKRSHRTRLMFCTTGVVLRRLIEDPTLHDVSHVVVDECHERQWQIDCLLVSLRRLIRTTRPDLKVILMSATLDTNLFSSFYDGAPVITIPGRTFPVKIFHLEDLLQETNHVIEENSRYAQRNFSKRETVSLWVSTRGGEKKRETADYETGEVVSDNYPNYSLSTRLSMDRVDESVLNYDLIEDVLEVVLLRGTSVFKAPDNGVDHDLNGAVLVFLPGIGEIRSLADRLTGSRVFGNAQNFDIIPLHSTLSSSEQRRAFRPSRKGCRKIILSTNIAETSVTIPDIVYVIDSGRVREIQRDKRTATRKLVSTWCARANAKQRAGRAGRVQAGVCLKLYSSMTESMVMKSDSEPELRRIPLEEVCLTILASGLTKSCTDFLLQAPQPPPLESVRAALQVLCDIGAVSFSELPGYTASSKPEVIETLTPLGQHLAKLPVDARVGKMLIFGTVFRCLDAVLTIAACLSASKSCFGSSFNDPHLAKSAHASFAHPDSDYFTLLAVWDAFFQSKRRGNDRAFCKDKYLNHSGLLEIRDARLHYVDLLCGIGFLDKKQLCIDERKRAFDERAIAESPYSSNSRREEIVHAVVCAGLYPNVAKVTKSALGQEATIMQKMDRLFIRDSVNSKLPIYLPSPWIIFFDKIGTERRISISNTAFVSPFCLLLFGSKIKVLHAERKVFVDDWIELSVSAKTGLIFREIRNHLNDLLAAVCEDSQGNQGMATMGKTSAVVDSIVVLLSRGQRTT